MNEEEIAKLYRKINELKFKYEIAKKFRIDLVDSMEDLDKRLSQLEEELQQARLNFKDNHINKIKESKLLKQSLIRTALAFLVSMIIIAGIDLLIFKNTTLLASQWQSTLFINVLFSMSPVAITKIINLKTKAKSRSIEEIENEYKQCIEQRISKGQEYKKAREEEVLAEKIYSELEKILTAEIVRIKMNDATEPTRRNIELKDIYYKIKLDPSFDSETIENKKNILDDELRKYLASKISEIYYNAVKTEDLTILTTEELTKMLINEVPIDKHHEVLSPLIHAIINFSSNLQRYGVVWFEESEETLIHNPEIIFDEEGRWTELKTHKNTNYQSIFKLVYNTFINSVMKKQTSKSRTKK